MRATHAALAMQVMAQREVIKFVHQRSRLFAALVRPTLWLAVYAVGAHRMPSVSDPPGAGPAGYQHYVIPGLLGMVLLFNGMQSSLSMVYDREMGFMRLILTAPLPRWYLLWCKLLAGTILSVLQAYAFLIICLVFGVLLPWQAWLALLPAMVVVGLMLGALGLLLSVTIRQLENFAGTMNFVIFPMFFLSSALYPLQTFRDAHATVIYWLCHINPFYYAVESMRGAMRGQVDWLAATVVVVTLAGFFGLAVRGYDPQKGIIRRLRQD